MLKVILDSKPSQRYSYNSPKIMYKEVVIIQLLFFNNTVDQAQYKPEYNHFEYWERSHLLCMYKEQSDMEEL